MPTYEYECEKCGKLFEVFQSMVEDRLTKCVDPKCKGKVTRLIGAGSGIIFKGSGFYETDYKRKESDSGSDSSANSSGESKSESKKETSAKSESKSKTESKSKSDSKSKSGGNSKSGGKKNS